MKKIMMAIVLSVAVLLSVGCSANEPVSGGDSSVSESVNSALQNKHAENKDAVLWLKIDGCEIDNPVFQGEDNDKYLRLDENGAGNIWGCYFLDYINNIYEGQFTDRVNIIYGHSKDDDPENKKFSKLKRYKDETFAKENPQISLDFLTSASKWQIFAATDVPISIDYIDPNPDSVKFDETFGYIIDNSYVDFGVDVSYEDKILILSTCTSDEDVRFVIAAKLVK